MSPQRDVKQIEILLVEDNTGDGELLLDFLEQSKVRNRIHWVKDGETAMAFMHREGKYAGEPLPDLILLDLNLPKKDGREVLADVRADPVLANIPVVVLTSSSADADIAKSYSLKANCYIVKPVDLNQFVAVIRSIETFWLTVVRLPTHAGGQHA